VRFEPIIYNCKYEDSPFILRHYSKKFLVNVKYIQSDDDLIELSSTLDQDKLFNEYISIYYIFYKSKINSEIIKKILDSKSIIITDNIFLNTDFKNINLLSSRNNLSTINFLFDFFEVSISKREAVINSNFISYNHLLHILELLYLTNDTISLDLIESIINKKSHNQISILSNSLYNKKSIVYKDYIDLPLLALSSYIQRIAISNINNNNNIQYAYQILDILFLNDKFLKTHPDFGLFILDQSIKSI
jgi:hypothetical protein